MCLIGVSEHFVLLGFPHDVRSQAAETRLAEVEASLQELEVLSNAVAEFFCEDPIAFKLEECCSIFHSFCKRFEAAVQVLMTPTSKCIAFTVNIFPNE